MPVVLPNERWYIMVAARTSAHQVLQGSLSDPGNDREHIERLSLAMANTSQHERDASTVDNLPLCMPHILYTEGLTMFRNHCRLHLEDTTKSMREVLDAALMFLLHALVRSNSAPLTQTFLRQPYKLHPLTLLKHQP